MNGIAISTKNTIKILGVTFDSRMKWNEHVSLAIKEANRNLYGINEDETREMITALYFP